MWTFKGTKISPTNTIGYVLLFIITVIALVQGRYTLAGATLLAAVLSAWMLKRTKGTESNELWRIVMFEPADERDRIISTKAMALVLQFDIWVGLIIGVGYALFAPQSPIGGLIVLGIEAFLLLKLAVFFLAAWFYSRRF